ncbi:MAG TPA: sigma-70 family RNA polymerase sigma factor [Steroidobacteraceae bacterium]|nr:sigma-70 family RNA polymerase sigma factor [Steroidobacteraceae bacterium]
MSLPQAKPDRWTAWASAKEVDWDALYSDHLPRIYNYFRFRVGTDADAEDLTASAFEKAWQARERYRQDLAAFSTWLFTIARNLAVDFLRSRRPQVPLDGAQEMPAEGTPEQDAERDSDLERLTALAAQLSEREQELIALKYGAELDNRQIARLLRLSESNVGTILHRAVQTLRRQW